MPPQLYQPPWRVSIKAVKILEKFEKRRDLSFQGVDNNYQRTMLLGETPHAGVVIPFTAGIFYPKVENNAREKCIAVMR
jgi:hypothetical protein